MVGGDVRSWLPLVTAGIPLEGAVGYAEEEEEFSVYCSGTVHEFCDVLLSCILLAAFVKSYNLPLVMYS